MFLIWKAMFCRQRCHYKSISLIEYCILIQICIKFVLKGPINIGKYTGSEPKKRQAIIWPNIGQFIEAYMTASTHEFKTHCFYKACKFPGHYGG